MNAILRSPSLPSFIDYGTYTMPEVQFPSWEEFQRMMDVKPAVQDPRRVLLEAEKALFSRDLLQIASCIIALEKLPINPGEMLRHENMLVDLEQRYYNTSGVRWENAEHNPNRQQVKQPVEIEIVGLPDEDEPEEKTYTQEEVDKLIAERERQWFATIMSHTHKLCRFVIKDGRGQIEFEGYFAQTDLATEKGQQTRVVIQSVERIT